VNRKRKRRSSSKLQRRLWTAAILLGLLSIYQYRDSGTVSWPRKLYDQVVDTAGDIAADENAGWRRAAGALGDIGAAREGTTPDSFDIEGRVVRVADGDTLSILDGAKRQHKVRLFGIDTPEHDQPHGAASRRALAQLVDDRHVGVATVETDNYGRTVGLVYLGDTNVNVAMISSGNAWWYRYYAPHERAMEQAESEARQAGKGLWAQGRPVPPWDWRRGKR